MALTARHRWCMSKLVEAFGPGVDANKSQVRYLVAAAAAAAVLLALLLWLLLLLIPSARSLLVHNVSRAGDSRRTLCVPNMTCAPILLRAVMVSQRAENAVPLKNYGGKSRTCMHVKKVGHGIFSI